MKPVEPYRLLFPIGLALALAGTLPWALYAVGLAPYPGALHRMVMVRGFEGSFVLGFLLTALPGLTRGERCRPWELAWAAVSMALLGLAGLAGRAAWVEVAFLAALALAAVALGRRLRRAPARPADEMGFILFGLALGAAGSALEIARWFGVGEIAPRFGERLISLGMLLTIVLGVGALLVPVFAGLPNPLAVPALARAHANGGRRIFYSLVLGALALAFAAEAAGRPGAGAALRASAATVVLLWLWKLWRLPGRRTASAWALWGSGWLIALGLWGAALAPRASVASLHVVFIGGFGLLTLGVATRVIVTHGRHGLEREARSLTPLVVGMVAAALVARLVFDWFPSHGTRALGVAAALWLLGWTVWALRAMPNLVRPRPAPQPPGRPT